MTPASMARLGGLIALWAGVELLERTAYRAGVYDTARAIVDDENRNRHRPLDNPGPDDEPWHCQICLGPCRNAGDDDPEAFDATDVLDLCPDPTRHEQTTGMAV